MAFVEVRRTPGRQGEGFRWQGLDAPESPLFPGLVSREFGRGEFRGMEFLHVESKRIINEVPVASQVPFRWTINAYRGCSHACTYCISPETPILMADGTTIPMVAVRPGDRVYGTKVVGLVRRYAVTEVVDHWATVKPAHRILLDDDAELTASTDHRFLTERGWRHVRDLQPGERVLGPGRSATSLVGKRVQLEGFEVKEIGPPRPEVTLYDMTTGTGDFIANGVVSHNCFARPTHEYLNLDSGRDFESKIVVKVNAVERLRAELAPRRWAGEHIAMGTNTDPYQRAEGKYRLTQGVIGVLSELRNPFSILTKGTLILRDLDLLAEAAQRTSVAANFSIGTLDEEVWKLTEPGTPHPRQRVEAVARLNDAGVETGVLLAPILPGLSDRQDQIDEVVGACIAAGARSITPITLHLRPGVREHYLGWLREHRPDLIRRHEAIYGRRAYAPKDVQRRISERVASAIDRHGGIPERRSGNARRIPPPSPLPQEPPPAEQLGLGL